ncbi:hypothetical protein N7G274_006364 [Stereocaulon virgatum]|uniref:Uncharacterized protein n=1 Tax=Stereocaulon virgatum TaxID=373712 RepID=A0ABR4A7L9_9LECA
MPSQMQALNPTLPRHNKSCLWLLPDALLSLHMEIEAFERIQSHLMYSALFKEKDMGMALTLHIITPSAFNSLLLSWDDGTCTIYGIHTRYQPLAVGSYNWGKTFKRHMLSEIRPVPCKKVT